MKKSGVSMISIWGFSQEGIYFLTQSHAKVSAEGRQEDLGTLGVVMTKQVIICVDDETTVLRSLKSELKEAFGNNYLIEIAEGGEEALELLTELLEDGCEIPLIISDYIMPDMKGDELLRRVHLISPKTLKVMLTGQATIEAVGNAIKYAKLYRYIAKPWQSEDLKLTVTEAIYSYFQDKKLAEKNVELQRVNQELEQLNREQGVLIAQLHEKESRLTQFLDAMPVGVGVLDARGKIYYVNQKAQDLFGKGVLSDISFEDLSEIYRVLIYKSGTNQEYPPADLPIVRALRGESAIANDLEIHQGNRIIPIETWATPIYDESGNITYAIIAFQDITERQKADAERERFTAELYQLNQAFSRFVPRQFLQFLQKESIVDVQVGDQVQQEMSVLFSDIRDFTTLSETMTPQQNFQFINSYLSHMEPAIIENQGFIDKYIGDGIMALFSGEADNAVKAGIEMLQRLANYNQHRSNSGYAPLKIGIGINTGSLMLGIVGGQCRMDSTVISDAVNLASRLESLTKRYEVPMLISHHTLARLQDPIQYSIRLIDRIKVKGRSNAVAIFEMLDGDAAQVREVKLATKTIFEGGLMLYYNHSFPEAAQLFQNVLSVNPGDKVAQMFLERTQQQMELVRRGRGGAGERGRFDS
jgi:class 3 adenylate cyclase/PAS domain-containing protein